MNCVKHLVCSSWLELNIGMRELINSTSIKKAIDEDQLDILTFLVSHPKRFAYIIDLLIDFNGHYFNLVSSSHSLSPFGMIARRTNLCLKLEYSIILKKKDLVRLFVSVRIPIEENEFRQKYKMFLKHYNKKSFDSMIYETPIQRMLLTSECQSLVPLVLEQFVSDNGIDLSIVDDCLYARPTTNRCLFGRTKHFSTNNWLQEHPLSTIIGSSVLHSLSFFLCFH